MTTLALAVVAAVVFYPLYKYVLGHTRGHSNTASFITIFIVTVVIIVPVTLIGAKLVQEATSLYRVIISSGDSNFLSIMFNQLMGSLTTYFPAISDVGLSLTDYFEKGLSLLINNALPIFSNITRLALDAFVFLMTLYFLLRDGDRLTDSIIKLSPLPDRDDEAILDSLRRAIHSVVTGSLLIAFIQGVVATVGFAIFGLPNAFLFGALTAIAALLPGIGTSLVVIPSVLYLTASGHALGAVGLLTWGMIAVGLVDNMLGPRLIGRGISLHPVIVFLAVIGGLSLFGPFGFIFGPLVLSLFITLAKFYFDEKCV